jgi:short-subunit dehydrogenase
MGPYVAAKHAVVAISEVLARDLEMAGSAVRVSVLCPGFVRTRIHESHRNRPASLAVPSDDQGSANAAGAAAAEAIRKLVEAGTSPDDVATDVVDAIRAERFYVLPHPDVAAQAVKVRMDDILGGRYPRLPPAPRG